MPALQVTLREQLQEMYFGGSRNAHRFRYGLVAFDLLVICVFLLETWIGGVWWMKALDLVFAALLAAELFARIYAERDRRNGILNFWTAADVLVLVSLLAPTFFDNLGFLRVVRALRLLRSYQFLRDLRSDSSWFRLYEDVIQRSINLAVFIFIVTSMVYVTQRGTNPGIQSYIDALYFTLTTLTTTGFGDITLQGPGGRLLAVVIMVMGVGLFLRLLQAVFRPNKVRFECQDCGLLLHDADAIRCKHCGRVLHIHTEGLV